MVFTWTDYMLGISYEERNSNWREITTVVLSALPIGRKQPFIYFLLSV
jgi:hypothetical protein